MTAKRPRAAKLPVAIRPSAMHRRETRLVSKAMEVFLERGYDATSMELIADRAEMTRRTIYNYFPGKEALFSRIIQAYSGRLLKRMDLAEDASAPAAAQLTRYCEAVADDLIKVNHLDQVRLLLDVAKRFPHLAEGLRLSTTEVFIANLARHLDDIVERGELEIADTRQAALILSAAIMLPMLRTLTGVTKPDVMEPSMHRMIREVIEMFCLRYKAKRRPKAARTSARRRAGPRV